MHPHDLSLLKLANVCGSAHAFAEYAMREAEAYGYGADKSRALETLRKFVGERYGIAMPGFSAVDVTKETKISEEWKGGSTHWRCTFTRGKRRMSVPFHMGSALKDPPTMWGVLSCLFSDAACAAESFESWAADMGHDTDSRKALATYKSCQSIAKRLAALFGDDLDTFAELSRDI